ncbi:MAG: hypothetical protein ACRDJ2_11895 [Actinomycetota bacterium]
MRVLMRVDSSEGDIAAHADALALQLAGAGEVYRGVAPVPPEARVSAPAPSDVIVALSNGDEGGRSALLAWAQSYLATKPEATVTFERDDKRLDVRAGDVGEAEGRMARLTST